MSTAGSGGKLDIGEILSDSFAILMKNLVPFVVLAIIVVAIPGFILNRLTWSAGSLDAIQTMSWISGIINSVLGYVLTASLVYGTFRSISGQTVSIGEMVSRGFAVILPVLGVAILCGIATGIGFLLLVVPGVILMTVFAVAIPAAVIERPGVIEAISRSVELTKGHRWWVFALFVIYGVSLFVIGLVFGGIAVASGSIGGGIIFALLLVLVSAILQAYFGVAMTVLYSKLRNLQEGVSTTEIAAVFD